MQETGLRGVPATPTTLNSEIPAAAKPSRLAPYIPDSANLRELTPIPLVVGTLLGIFFVPLFFVVVERLFIQREGSSSHAVPVVPDTGSATGGLSLD